MSGDDQIELCIATELSSNAQVIHLSGSQLCECAADALELRRQMETGIAELKEAIESLRTHGSPWRRERAQVVRYLDARMTPVDSREVARSIERGDHWADCYREASSRTANGLTDSPDPEYDLRVPDPRPADPQRFGQQWLFGFWGGSSLREAARSSRRPPNKKRRRRLLHWLRENGVRSWPPLVPDAPDSASQPAQERRSVVTEGGTSAQGPDCGPETVPGAELGTEDLWFWSDTIGRLRLYGYGIVDRDGRPRYGCEAVCESRSLIDWRYRRLNEHAVNDGDNRAPYRVVRLLIDNDPDSDKENR